MSWIRAEQIHLWRQEQIKVRGLLGGGLSVGRDLPFQRIQLLLGSHRSVGEAALPC